MGLIASMLAGGLEGAGQAGVKVGLAEQEAAIHEERAKRLAETQKEMEALRHANEIARVKLADELKRAPAKEAMAKIEKANKPVVVDDGQGGGNLQAPTIAEQRANERKAFMASGDSGLISAAVASEGHDIQREGQDKQERMGERQIASQEKLATEMRASQERIAGMHASIQKQIAEMGTTVQVLEDGTMAVVNKKGETVNYVRDPSTGEKLTSKKNLAEGDRALMASLVTENKGYEAIMKDPLSSPEQRAAAAAQAKENTTQLWALAGREKPKTEQPEPPAAAIEDLRKDPSLAAQFKAKFKVDPQKYLAPATTAAKPAPGLLASSAKPDAQARYLKALGELNAMKGGILPTAKGNEGMIKAKEEEVNRLLQETY